MILPSEGYRDRASAHNRKAANHSGHRSSEMYGSERSRDAGIASAMAIAPDTGLVEE